MYVCHFGGTRTVGQHLQKHETISNVSYFSAGVTRHSELGVDRTVAGFPSVRPSVTRAQCARSQTSVQPESQSISLVLCSYVSNKPVVWTVNVHAFFLPLSTYFCFRLTAKKHLFYIINTVDIMFYFAVLLCRPMVWTKSSFQLSSFLTHPHTTRSHRLGHFWFLHLVW